MPWIDPWCPPVRMTSGVLHPAPIKCWYRLRHTQICPTLAVCTALSSTNLTHKINHHIESTATGCTRESRWGHNEDLSEKPCLIPAANSPLLSMAHCRTWRWERPRQGQGGQRREELTGCWAQLYATSLRLHSSFHGDFISSKLLIKFHIYDQKIKSLGPF